MFLTVMNSKWGIYPSKRYNVDKRAKHFSHQCTSVSISEGWVHYRVHSVPGLSFPIAERNVNFHLHTLSAEFETANLVYTNLPKAVKTASDVKYC